MGCGSSSSRVPSPTQRKPLETRNEAIETNHTDTQSILKESTDTNGLSKTTKQNNYITNDSEKQNDPKINQELVIPSQDHENDKNILNLSQSNKTKEKNEISLPTTGVAFEVKFDENSGVKGIRRPPKLQKLENITVLTADMLAKKQAIAEENRQREIQKKLAKTSKRKKQLLEAREMDRTQAKLMEIEEKMNAQKKKRARVQAEIVGKQRRRELRAQQVRAKAERIREGEDMVDFDVDPDNTFNADEEDESWDMERTDNQLSKSSRPSSTRSQLEEQVEPEKKHATDNTEQSVYDFFEE